MDEGNQPGDVEVDTKFSLIKRLWAKWIISAYDYIRPEPGIVHRGFVEAGIVEVIEKAESEHCGDLEAADDEKPFKVDRQWRWN